MREINALEGHFIILSLPLLGSLVSLPLSLSDSPSGHTINCQLLTSLSIPPLLFPSLLLSIAKVTDVEDGNVVTWRGRGRVTVCVAEGGALQGSSIRGSVASLARYALSS